MSDYSFEDGTVYSMVSGKMIAKVDPESGALSFEPGCAAAHGKKLSDWMEKNGIRLDGPGKQGEASAGETSAEQTPAEQAPSAAEETEKRKKRFLISNIPEGMLPEWDPVLGVETPGFRRFCVKSKLTEEQVIELIRRLEKHNRSRKR